MVYNHPMILLRFVRSTILCFLLFAPIFGADQSVLPHFKIPFRLPKATNPSLSPSDLTLTINGRSSAVESLKRIDDPFASSTGNRIIILAVAGGRYTEELDRFLETLYREIMAVGDRLVLCTPFGSETFDRTADQPGPGLKPARDRLREDMTIFTSMLDKMERNLIQIREELSSTRSDSRWNRMLDRYEPLAGRLIDQLLAAYLAPLGQAFGLLDNADRPVWLLLFDEDLPLYERVGWPLLEENAAQAMKPATQARIARFADRIQSAQKGDLGELADEMMLRRIHLLGFDTRAMEPRTTPSTGFLGLICHRNGLHPTPFSRSQEAVTLLNHHQDTLWELLTPFDGVIEEKNLSIRFNSLQGSIAHPLRIRAEAFAALAGQPTAPLTIESVSIEENHLVCRISNISMKEKSGGRLRVRVRIQDENQAGRFDQEKELEAHQAVLTIRLPLPEEIQGYLGLTVDVTDLLNRGQDQKRVYLKR